MSNEDSYKLMEVLRSHLKIKLIDTPDIIEIVLQFQTKDGKIHQLCNTFKEKYNAC